MSLKCEDYIHFKGVSENTLGTIKLDGLNIIMFMVILLKSLKEYGVSTSISETITTVTFV